MDRLLKHTLLAACLSCMPFSAYADPVEWGTFGKWSVNVEPDLGFGCYVSRLYEDRTILHVGFAMLPGNAGFYVLLRNDKWKSLKDDKAYALHLSFDSKKALELEATGSSSSHGLSIVTKMAKLMAQFETSSQLLVTYDGKEVADLRLDGAKTAFSQMRACQDETEKMLRKSAEDAKQQDPFAKTP